VDAAPRGEWGLGVQEAIEDMKLDDFVAQFGELLEWDLNDPEKQIKQLEKDIALAEEAGLTEVRPPSILSP
jgi:hypothetical protein